MLGGWLRMGQKQEKKMIFFSRILSTTRDFTCEGLSWRGFYNFCWVSPYLSELTLVIMWYSNNSYFKVFEIHFPRIRWNKYFFFFLWKVRFAMTKKAYWKLTWQPYGMIDAAVDVLAEEVPIPRRCSPIQLGSEWRARLYDPEQTFWQLWVLNVFLTITNKIPSGNFCIS